jgi:hypothetical protein
VERGLPGILFYEDHEHMTPHMHRETDVVGTSLNNDTLFEANVRAAAATVFTLARPIRPDPVFLMASREPGDPPETVRLDWTGGFPGYDLHRSEMAADVRDDANKIAEELFVRQRTDERAGGRIFFYSVEEYP